MNDNSDDFSFIVEEDAKASVDWRDHEDTPREDTYTTATSRSGYHSMNTEKCASFIADTGATVHISPIREDFHMLVPITPKKIRGVGGSIIYATAIGKIALHIAKGVNVTLENVLFVPSANIRLMSIGKVCEGGNEVIFDTDKFVVRNKKTKTTVMTGTRRDGRLWTIGGSSEPKTKHSAKAFAATLETWHKRLGHIGVETIKRMARMNMATGMPVDFSLEPPLCESCIHGKQTRTSVPKKRKGKRSERKLGVVCVDLAGPQAVESARHNKYSMELVDEYTGMIWSISLRSKDRAFHELKKWEKQRKLECGEEVGIYRVDGGELDSDEMREWIANHGTKEQLTAPYTSAQNGIVERSHRVIFELGQTMRIACGAPPNTWDYFNETAAYIAQRRPCRAQPNMTPYEVWYGKKPDMSHMREIGCKAFVLIQNKHNPKIYDKSLECVLIGYASNAKAYLCYHKASHKVITSFHVRFKESWQESARPLQPGRIVNDDDIPPEAPEKKEHIWTDDSSDEDEETPEPAKQNAGNAAPPRRSKQVPGPSGDERVRQAVESSKESGQAKARERAEKKAAREKERANAFEAGLEEEGFNPNSPDEPTIQEVLDGNERNKWLAAIHDELKSIKNMGVYEAIPRSSVPKDRRIMKGKFVLRRKRNEEGVVTRHKARYVLRGFEMMYGKDYTKTTSPTARMESLRILYHIAAT